MMDNGIPKLLPMLYTLAHWRAAMGAGASSRAGTLMKESEALPPAYDELELEPEL